MVTKKSATSKAAVKRPANKTARPVKRARVAKGTENLPGVVASATLRDVRISAQKARLVVNLIKGKEAERALDILQYSPKKGARLVFKLLKSAIANAREQKGVNVDTLVVVNGWADGGRTMKRYLPRARGSANMLHKRSSHITVVLGERGI